MSADEGAQLLAGEVAVEEKLDGANLGFSLAPDGVLRAQNRGQYLAHPHAGQQPAERRDRVADRDAAGVGLMDRMLVDASGLRSAIIESLETARERARAAFGPDICP